MAAGLRPDEAGLADEIDMERVVSDGDYRRRIIGHLRLQRLHAAARRQRLADALDPGEED